MLHSYFIIIGTLIGAAGSVAYLIDTVKDCLKAYGDMVPALQAKRDTMRRAALRGYATATDLADYLVKKGIPFRDAHEIVGKSVAYGLARGKDLSEFDLAEFHQFSDIIGEDVFGFLTLEGSVNARNHIGGTAPAQVRRAIEAGRLRLQERQPG